MKKILSFFGVIVLFSVVIGIYNDTKKSNNKDSPTIINIDKQYSQNSEKPIEKENQKESILSVKLIELTPENYNKIAKAYSDMGVKIKVKNTGDKNIEAFMGLLEVYDIFGERISSFKIKEDETIKAGEEKIIEYSYTINLFDSERNKLFNLTKWNDKFILDKVMLLDDVILKN